MKNVVWRRKMEDRGGGLGLGLGYEGATLVLGSTFTREKTAWGLGGGFRTDTFEWHVESPKQS